MRCGCAECGAYMVHSEGLTLGCVCPQCGNRCTACLGTNTVVSREELRRWKQDLLAERLVLDRIRQDEARGDEEALEERPGRAADEEDGKWRG